MIDLTKHKLRGFRGCHTWRALEEILAFEVVIDGKLPDLVDKRSYLQTLYKYANIFSIPSSSSNMKIGNYRSLTGTSVLGNCNHYTEDVVASSSSKFFKDICDDIYINYWRKNTLKTSISSIFINHDITILYSNRFRYIGYRGSYLTLSYFKRKLEAYKQSIIKYVTPQRYIDHINAIGHLDKIIFISKDEALLIGDDINNNIPRDINDYMGMFIPCVKDEVARKLSSMTGGSVKKDETIILLCLENMEDTIGRLVNNHPSLEEMVDKVFSHEIGHLAFYFYYSNYYHRENWRDIAEKQANWISSISHNGKIDSLIEEICSMQSYEYQNPILLKHKCDLRFHETIEKLYMRE